MADKLLRQSYKGLIGNRLDAFSKYLDLYSSIHEKKILYNKQFWKVVKPLFSSNSVSGNTINLTDNDEQVKTEMKTTIII